MNKDWTEQESYWGMVSDERKSDHILTSIHTNQSLALEGAFAFATATAESPEFAENRYGATWIENDDGDDIPDITSEIDYDMGDDGSQAVDETEVIGIENDDAGDIQQVLPSPAAKYAQGDEVEETEFEHDSVGDFHQVSLFPAAKHTQVEYDSGDGLPGSMNTLRSS